MGVDTLLTKVIELVDAEVRQAMSDHDFDDSVLDGCPDHQRSVKLTALAVIDAVRESDFAKY